MTKEKPPPPPSVLIEPTKRGLAFRDGHCMSESAMWDHVRYVAGKERESEDRDEA